MPLGILCSRRQYLAQAVVGHHVQECFDWLRPGFIPEVVFRQSLAIRFISRQLLQHRVHQRVGGERLQVPMESVCVVAFHIMRAESAIAKLRPQLRRTGIRVWIQAATVFEKACVLQSLSDIRVPVGKRAESAAVGQALHPFAVQEQPDVFSFRHFGSNFCLIWRCPCRASLRRIGVRFQGCRVHLVLQIAQNDARIGRAWNNVLASALALLTAVQVALALARR